MSNPWQELFEDIRFENGNDYFYQSLNEEEEGGVSSAMVAQAVQKIKRIAKRDGVRIQVAMTTFFSNTRLSPSERAAVRNKVAELGESYEIDENIQAIASGYKRADMNTARSLGNAQMMQQRLDAQRNAQRNQAQQSKKRLTTGGAPTQYSEENENENELVEKAVSAAQQRFMGMVYAAKKGKMKAPSAEVEKAAASMTKKEAKKFAKTKHKGLPEKITKEDFEAFIEEKYGEKYEKNYKKTGKKSKDYDGDGTVEDEGDEYAGVKDRAIKAALKKKVLNNSFSDWRNDFDFIDEKRYPESPFVEVMPEQKASGDEDKKAANLRLKPKKSNVSEEIELANQLAESLGGTLVFEGVRPKDVFQGLQYATKAAPAISNALKQALSKPPAGALTVVTPKAITAPKIVDAATKLLPAAKVTRTATKAAPATKTASVSKSLTQPKNSPVLVDPVTGVITKTPKGTKSKTAPLAAVSLPKPETLTKVEKRNRNKTIAALRDGRGGGGSTGTPGPGSGFGPTRGSGNIPIPSPPKSGEGRIYQAISL
jgi:hypothetical protein